MWYRSFSLTCPVLSANFLQQNKRLRDMNGSPAGLIFRLHQYGHRFLGLVHHCNHRYVRPIYEFTMLVRIQLTHTYIFTLGRSRLCILIFPHTSFAKNFRVTLKFVIVVTMNCACVIFITTCTFCITMRNWETVSTLLPASYHRVTLLSAFF